MKIAIIGSGISGLGAAYLLHSHHDITVYEANDYIGGHSRTVDVTIAGQPVSVDTGFIVFNYRNYPHLTALFEHLQVDIAKSDMSFGVSINEGWLEYGTRYPLSLFAQLNNICSLRFWGMVRDILRFNKHALTYIDSTLSLRECLDDLKLGEWFRRYYLLAMGGSIWSMPLESLLDFPAETFIRFFHNHGLLTVNDQPQWYTVKGGSKQYVQKLVAPFKDKIQLQCRVTHIIRHADYVEVVDSRGQTSNYDQVVLACHSDQIVSLLHQPQSLEYDVLSAIRYQSNEMVLHTDTGFMPKRKAAWSSWVYLSNSKNDNTSCVSLSYWMNNLQPLPTETPVIVTLNPGTEPAAESIMDRYQFTHPVFDRAAIEAQAHIQTIQGKDRIWYAGAWQKYGFHEDGLASAVTIAEQMGVSIPWK